MSAAAPTVVHRYSAATGVRGTLLRWWHDWQLRLHEGNGISLRLKLLVTVAVCYAVIRAASPVAQRGCRAFASWLYRLLSGNEEFRIASANGSRVPEGCSTQGCGKGAGEIADLVPKLADGVVECGETEKLRPVDCCEKTTLERPLEEPISATDGAPAVVPTTTGVKAPRAGDDDGEAFEEALRHFTTSANPTAGAASSDSERGVSNRSIVWHASS